MSEQHTEAQKKEIMRLVDECVSRLMEHGTAVQILLTFDDGDNTADIIRGRGNWYARTGMAHEFLLRNRSHNQAFHIRQQLQGNDEDE